MDRGKLIVFEGLDGSGKTTHLINLRRRMVSLGIRCVEAREPSDSPVGLIARSAGKGKISLENETMALLYAADRIEHIVKDLLPALEKGITVLCDRYYHSNFAYQSDAPYSEPPCSGSARESTPLARVLNYNEVAMGLLRPDMTVFLDVPPEECMKRLSEDRAETEKYENLEKLKSVRENFLRNFEAMGDRERIVVIDASGSEANIFEKIWMKVMGFYF